MGCFDVYCFVCGNNPYGLTDDISSYDAELMALIKNKTKHKRINYKATIDNISKLIVNTAWMNNCSMLLVNDDIIHNLYETAGNVRFENKDVVAEHIIPLYSRTNFAIFPCGVFIHTDCLNYVNHKFNIDLRYSHLPPMAKIHSKKIFDFNYGIIEKYYSQFFDFLEVAIDNKVYLCSSPLKRDKNITQIDKNISNLKLKRDPNRKGPMTSATFYKNKTIKVGRDGMFWIIKNGKWQQIKDKPIMMKINIDINKISNREKKYIERIPYIGETNNNGIFIIKSARIITNRHAYKIELLLLDDYKNILEHKLTSINC